ncbi:MAG TPA: hypothetical protein VJ785_10845 [Anaerolineales bacterium]|nr:hypothetical protein [Anaerolineales bacterium]
MNGNTGLRIIAVLVLVAAIAGIGFFAYQAGVAQGSPITIEAPSGETAPMPYPYYGWGMPYHHPFGFGFGCFGFLILLFLFFLAFKAFRFAMWGPRWGWGHHHGAWGRGWEDGAPPMFDEWHKRAHNVSTERSEKPQDRKE